MAGVPKALSVRTALAWSFAERYSSLIVTLISTMLLARLLTPVQIGIFSLCASVTAVAGILRDFGVSEYINQEKDLTSAKMRSVFGIAIIIAWSIGAAIFFSRHLISAYYNEIGVAKVLGVLSLNFLILPFASPAFALMSREMAFRKIFVVQIASNAIQAVTGVTLAFQSYGYMSLAWAPVAGIITQTVLISVMRPRDSFLLPAFSEARHVLKYGSMFVLSRFIETFTRNAHEFIIARQSGFTSVGLFSRAFGLIELFNSNVTNAVMRVASPAFAADYRAGRQLNNDFARGTAIFTSIAFPFLGFIGLMAPEIIRVLFGPQWDAAAPLASILAIALIPSYLVALGPQLLAATGQVRRRLKISLWFCPVHLIGVLMASFISLKAVAMVWGFSNTVMLAMYMHHLKQVLGASTGELFMPSLRSILVTGISLVFQVTALILCRGLQFPALASLLFVTAVAAISWFLAVKGIRHPVHEEILRFIRLRRAPVTL